MTKFFLLKLSVWGVLFLVSACQPLPDTTKQEGILVAQVHDKKLYLDKIRGFIPSGTSAEDSLMTLNAYAQRWIREALMLHLAEENITEEWKIEELVEDYRASLVRHNYEQVLVETLLDSTISDQELRTFYDRNKAQYELETAIVRCDLIKIPRNVRLLPDFEEWWKEGKKSYTGYKKLSSFCKLNAEVSIVNDTAWYSLDQLSSALPKGTLTEQNIKSKQEWTQMDEQYRYFFRVYDVIQKKSIAPLSYIEDQAKRFILKQKKEELLKKFKDDLYQKELVARNVKIFTEK